eukprot:10968218-Lingulodinium_polyedra.AAC.1
MTTSTRKTESISANSSGRAVRPRGIRRETLRPRRTRPGRCSVRQCPGARVGSGGVCETHGHRH